MAVKRVFLIAGVAALTLATAGAQMMPPPGPVEPLTAQEQLKTFKVPPGYEMQLVLAEPFVQEPVAIAFDGDGRMYVAEMLTYMQTIDGDGQMNPVSRVTVHWSSKGDGNYDKHAIFADKLLLPRMILPLGPGQLVIGETNTNQLNLFTDTDGDGKSDKQEVWFPGEARGGNLEHQPSGLVWALDNGIYTTYNNFRLRWTPEGVVKEDSAGTSGQWGMGQDDNGHLYLVNAGNEKGPQNFQEPLVYGSFNPTAQLTMGFNEVFPLIGAADVQGGNGRHRDDGTLNNLTACAGAEIYRGDLMPELRGSLFFGEPVGRLVRQATVEDKFGLITLSNPFQKEKSEFLRSSDLCFRPVNMNTAPDGSLYIVDMYRGIIQEGNWVNEGSYLREKVKEYALDKIIGRGRIWRLVKTGAKPGPQPKLYSEKPAGLVKYLAHPNGWWRDTAQKLLILQQDKSVTPALETMARSDKNHLARMHALWTLQGLDALTPGIVRAALADPQPEVRVTGIRINESLDATGDESLKPQILSMVKDPDPNVVKQVFLSGKINGWSDWKDVATAVVETTPYDGVKIIADMTLNPPKNQPSGNRSFSEEEKKVLTAGGEIFEQMCAACHGADGRGTPMAGMPGRFLAPALAGSDLVVGPKEGPVAVLLNGLTGPIDGKQYDGVMVSMASNDDEWIANVSSYIRNAFGNSSPLVSAGDVARMRTATKGRVKPWTIEELRAALPPYLNRKTWKVTASDNDDKADQAIDNNDGSRWDTSKSQASGMWYQVEFPEETVITALQLDASKSPGDSPRKYEVSVSTDGKEWSKPLAEGEGTEPVLNIHFPPTPAKMLRVTQTGEGGGFWSIHELQILGERQGASSSGR